jgi:hypothetical protein
MKPYEVDVAVLCIFFTRPDHFGKVFEQIKKAKPSKLFLYQDGPRAGREDDIKAIEECRRIAEDIDWDCQVYKFYQPSNVGCDPSEYIALKWMFEHVDKGIILEDDDVPAVSFFRFCKELLDKYENDTRIFRITGLNHMGKYHDEYADYIFSERSSIWGWATWKRCIDMLDTEYTFLDNEYTKSQMKQQVAAFEEKVRTCQWHKSTGKAYYESIVWNTVFTNHMMDIVPTKNMISNIGIGANGTHGASSTKALPKGIRNVFFRETYELDFPIRHPQHVVADVDYAKKVCRILGEGYPLVQFYRGIEGGIKGFYYSSAEEKKKKLGRLPSTIKNLLSKLKNR